MVNLVAICAIWSHFSLSRFGNFWVNFRLEVKTHADKIHASCAFLTVFEYIKLSAQVKQKWKKNNLKKQEWNIFVPVLFGFIFSYEGSLRHVPGQPRLCNTVEYTICQGLYAVKDARTCIGCDTSAKPMLLNINISHADVWHVNNAVAVSSLITSGTSHAEIARKCWLVARLWNRNSNFL